MSFEIIIRRDTEKVSNWRKEPELTFVNEKNAIRLTSQEKFEDNSPKKRFLFLNIQTIHSFPNLNLNKYELFYYNESTVLSSHLAIYVTEDFDHLGIFVFNNNNLNEKLIDFNSLLKYYHNLKDLKQIIVSIKSSFLKKDYDFYDNYSKLIYKYINETFPTYLKKKQRETIILFFRQNIKELKKVGEELIFNYSYAIIFQEFIINSQNVGKIHFDLIIMIFEKFQQTLNSLKLEKIEEIKLIYSASSLLGDFINNDDFFSQIYIYNKNDILNNNLMEIINFNEFNSIYSYVENKNYEIIENLTTESFLYQILNQLNSSKGENLLKTNFERRINSTCSMISMITLHNLKSEFYSIKQKYGIKIGFKTNYFAITNVITKITTYNEINIFGKYLKFRSINHDNYYTNRLKLSTTMKHERFTHTLVSINIFTGNLDGSPMEYINFHDNTVIELITKQMPESGNAFEFLITKDKNFIEFLKNPPKNIKVSSFFDYTYWIGNTMGKLYELYEQLNNKNEKKNQINYNNFKYKKKIFRFNENKKYYINYSKNEFNENDYDEDKSESRNPELRICKYDYCDIFEKFK